MKTFRLKEQGAQKVMPNLKDVLKFKDEIISLEVIGRVDGKQPTYRTAYYYVDENMIEYSKEYIDLYYEEVKE